MNYYRLETDTESWYLNFSMPVNQYVVDAETGTQCTGGSYGGSDIWDFMENGKTYYAVFWASPGEAYYEEAGEKGNAGNRSVPLCHQSHSEGSGNGILFRRHRDH